MRFGRCGEQNRSIVGKQPRTSQQRQAPDERLVDNRADTRAELARRSPGKAPVESPRAFRQILREVEVGPLEMAEMAGFGGSRAKSAKDPFRAAAVLVVDLVEQ